MSKLQPLITHVWIAGEFDEITVAPLIFLKLQSCKNHIGSSWFYGSHRQSKHMH